MSTVPAIQPLAPVKTWSEETNNGVNYERLFAIGERKLRVRIHAESYVIQSYGQLEVLDPTANKWNLLATIPGPLLKVNYHTGRSNATAFEPDVAALLAEATTIFSA
jgi:hypothetical protein